MARYFSVVTAVAGVAGYLLGQSPRCQNRPGGRLSRKGAVENVYWYGFMVVWLYGGCISCVSVVSVTV